MRVFCDSCFKKNGKASIGIIGIDDSFQALFQHTVTIPNIRCNDIGEYHALLQTLEFLIRKGIYEADIMTDSSSVYNHLFLLHRGTEEYAPIKEKIQTLLNQHQHFRVWLISSDENIAHFISRDSKLDYTQPIETPLELSPQVIKKFRRIVSGNKYTPTALISAKFNRYIQLAQKLSNNLLIFGNLHMHISGNKIIDLENKKPECFVQIDKKKSRELSLSMGR